MAKQQLYISGVAVDMPQDGISIKVESNLFSDAGNIKTAHSYNIALPRTMNNDRIFALAYVPSAETGGKTTHTYLKASLYMDGVPLFEDGQAVLTNVDTKGYNLNLYWGLLGVFDEIKKEGLDLCDMAASSRWDEATMSPPSNWIYIPKQDLFFPTYDSGMTQEIYDNDLTDESKQEADKLPWLMPSVSANTILDKIAQVYGLNLEKSYYANQRISTLWHPLTSLRVMAKGETLTINVDATTILGTGLYQFICLPDTSELSSSNSHICASGFAMWSNAPNAGRTLYANNKAHATSIRVYGTCDKEFIAIVGTQELQSTYNSLTGLWEMDKTIYDITGDKILQIAPPSYIDPSYGWGTGVTPQVDVHATLVFDEIGDIINFGVGSVAPYLRITWNYERNYPKIEIIKYLSEILAHIGGCIVGSVTKPNTLKICTFDEICDADPIILDEYGIETISMSMDGLAQKNVYTHAENDDEGLAYDAEGVIYTNDPTLELERTAFESKFKVPVSGIVRLWKVEDDDNTEGKKKASWDASGNYIAGFISDGNIITNTGQDFLNTIANYYINYEQIVNRPKEVVAIVRMSVLELLNFDLAKPLYIKQLGRKYLIKTLEGDSNDTYKLTLVQI